MNELKTYTFSALLIQKVNALDKAIKINLNK